MWDVLSNELGIREAMRGICRLVNRSRQPMFGKGKRYLGYVRRAVFLHKLDHVIVKPLTVKGIDHWRLSHNRLTKLH